MTRPLTGASTVLALVLVLAAGCASHQGVSGGGGQPATSGGSSAPGVAPPPTPPNARVPPGALAVPSTRVDATALPPTYPRLVWTHGDGRTIGLYGEQGGCDTVSAMVTEQTSSAVTVLLVDHRPRTDLPCPMYLRYVPLTVSLDQPLGDRTVVLRVTVMRG